MVDLQDRGYWSTFFVANKNIKLDIIWSIMINDLVKLVIEEIIKLPNGYRNIYKLKGRCVKAEKWCKA